MEWVGDRAMDTKQHWIETKLTGVRILVVDDERVNRELYRHRLESVGIDVHLADCGEAALELLDREAIDVVLLDIVMPRMTGVDVLRQIRTAHSRTELPVIMATAREASEDVVSALRLGANDYVSKPVDFDVLFARVRSQLELCRATGALAVANKRMREELQTAAEIQKALLPKVLPENGRVRLEWNYRPCDELAGDILNIFRLDEERLGLYLLDVSGHGVPAALLSSALSHLLTPARSEGTVLWEQLDSPDGARLVSPARVAERLNSRFQLDDATCQYFTLHYGIFDSGSGVYRYLSAGHPRPLLLKADGTSEFPEGVSPAIGIINDVQFSELQIDLQPGDTLCVYSDGIVESLDANEEEFGRERFVAAVKAARESDPEHILDRVIESVREWCGGEQQDDISLIALHVR